MNKKIKGFENDLLNRGNFGKNLCSIFYGDYRKYLYEEDKSLVLGIDGKWGLGKTTFVNMLSEHIDKRRAKVIKFNAWENDDWNDPFMPLFNNIINEYSKDLEVREKLFSSAKEIVKYFGKNVAKVAVKTAVKKIVEKFDQETSKKMKETLEGFSNEEIKKFFGNEMKEKRFKQMLSKNKFTELCEGMDVEKFEQLITKCNLNHKILNDYLLYENSKRNFQKLLNELTKTQRKLVVIIDELDRCRPDFAVKLLETIKHFMNNEKLIYVFSLDTKQLSYSVATMYGEKMDSYGYLRRFFHLIIELPINYDEMDEFVKEICKQYNNNICSVCVQRVVKVLKLSLRDTSMLIRNLSLFHDTVENEYLENNDKSKLFYYYIIGIKMIKPIVFDMLVNNNWASIESGRENREGYYLDSSLYNLDEDFLNLIVVLADGGNQTKVPKSINIYREEINEFYKKNFWYIDHIKESSKSLKSNISKGEYVKSKLKVLTKV